MRNVALPGAGHVPMWDAPELVADVLLRDSDVMSMRHSLELRVPFVDRPLVEWLWRQPSAYQPSRMSMATVTNAASATSDCRRRRA